MKALFSRKFRQIHIGRVLHISFLVLLIAILLVMGVTAAFSLVAFQSQARRSSATLLSFYGEELEGSAASLESFIQNSYLSDENFLALAKGNVSNNMKLRGEHHLRSAIRSAVPYDGLIHVFDESGAISVWQVGTGFDSMYFNQTYDLVKRLEAHVKRIPENRLYHWGLYSEGRDSLLFLPYRKGELYLVAAIDLSKFITAHGDFEASRDYQVAFFNDRQILTNQEYLADFGITVRTLTENRPSVGSQLRYVINTADIEGLPVRICSIMPIAKYLLFYRPFLAITLLLSALLIGLVLASMRRISRIITYPLDQIALASERLSQGKDPIPYADADTPSRIVELNSIHHALRDLVNQKVTLANEKERQKIEQEHAQLQYFQLQTRSHFFINCLKSLYNMLEMKEYDKMKRMILDFSDHIRFIFHDNLSLIPLQEELDEVDDYANIIRIDSTAPLMVIRKVPDELLMVKVPPLLIQTFLENSIKHNSAVKQLLQFIIQADETESEGRRYIRIRMSDNGTGYDADMLNRLNYDKDNAYERYHVGISNLKRRMEILYGGDSSIAFFNDPGNGGAAILIFIPLL